MTDEELAAIEARANVATPGPWLSFVYGPYDAYVRDSSKGDRGDPVAHFRANVSNADNDARFVAAARADVPALVAEVRRLRASLRRAESDHARDMTHPEDL